MKRLCLMICVFGLMVSGTRTAMADTWQVVYQTDFSTDPGWVTNDPTNCHWNANTETYHAWMANRNTSYAVKEISWDNQSFILEWDLRINSCEWSAGATFGLFDPQFLSVNSSICGDYGLVDQGYGRTIQAHDGNDYTGVASYTFPWQKGVWYRNRIIYDAGTFDLTLYAYDRDSMNLIETLTINNGPFPCNIDYMGLSRLHMEGYNNYAVDLNIDNVILSVPGPTEPPIADAGDDIIASANEEVTLDASDSNDPDGEIIRYTWKRLPDDVVIYSGEEPTCQTRALGRAEEVIELTVTDNYWATATDTVRIINRTTQDLKDQVAEMQSQIEQLQQQIQGLQALVDQIASWRPIIEWLRRAE